MLPVGVIYVNFIHHFLPTLRLYISIYFCLIFHQNLEPTKEERRKVPYPIIIGVSCGGIFILAAVSIYLLRICHRRKMASRGRNSCVMPTKVSVQNPEKYELQQTESKEDIVRYEEIGMWTDNVCYGKLPVSHDAAGYEKLNFSTGAIYQEQLGIPNVGGDYQEICISNDAVRYQETGFLKKPGQK